MYLEILLGPLGNALARSHRIHHQNVFHVCSFFRFCLLSFLPSFGAFTEESEPTADSRHPLTTLFLKKSRQHVDFRPVVDITAEARRWRAMQQYRKFGVVEALNPAGEEWGF